MKKKIMLVVFALVFLLPAAFKPVAALEGDVSGPEGTKDGVVDMFDIVAVGNAFGSKPTDPEPSRWNGDADLVVNGVINIFDLVMVAINYGKTGV